MKLDNKRTILVGLAFLSICAFWQMYDGVMTLILTGTFHLNETTSWPYSCCPCSAACPTGRIQSWASAPPISSRALPSRSSS